MTSFGQELGISRQGVFDNLSRTEALLRNMETKTGCVRRDLQCRKAMQTIRQTAQMLVEIDDNRVSNLARQIMDAAQGLEE